MPAAPQHGIPEEVGTFGVPLHRAAAVVLAFGFLVAFYRIAEWLLAR